jgi:uncharacterized protein (DUF2336 family)
VEPQRSLINEIEGAIASGSPEQRVVTLRRVTDLFVGRSDDYSEVQVDLFDDVISRLADRIETKARAELANRLAAITNAPRQVLRGLAFDESIDVAGPVLSQSTRLTEADLLACAESTSQDRLLAISKRVAISEAISDVLVTRGDREVVRSVASNEGARFSHAGFGRLIQKSNNDEQLAVSVGTRKDIPKEHFQALVSKASEAVFKKLAASNPAAASEVKRVLFDVTGRNAVPENRVERDYTQAKATFDVLRRSNEPIEPAVHSYAKAGKFEEVAVALSELCKLPIDVVERLMTDKNVDDDLVLILSKAANFSWPTAKLIMLLRRGDVGLSPQDAETAHQHFDRLQPGTAQRVVRFYQVRKVSDKR